MGWLDDLIGGDGGSIWGGGSDIWSGGGGNFGESGFDWGSLWGDIGQDGSWTSNWGWLNGNGGSGVWGDAIGDAFGGGDSGGGSAGGWLSSLFGGGSGGQNGNLWGSLLAGLGGAADQYMNSKNMKEAMAEQGRQSRLTLDYGAAIKDHYDQLNKQRKRVALDTYGQFSLLGNNVTPAPAVQVPPKPSPGS